MGDPFITPSPTLLIISVHIPTQWDVCTIVIAHKEKYTEFQQLNILPFYLSGNGTQVQAQNNGRPQEDYIYLYR